MNTNVFICEFCDRKFITKSILHLHLRSLHEVEPQDSPLAPSPPVNAVNQQPVEYLLNNEVADSVIDEAPLEIIISSDEENSEETFAHNVKQEEGFHEEKVSENGQMSVPEGGASERERSDHGTTIVSESSVSVNPRCINSSQDLAHILVAVTATSALHSLEQQAVTVSSGTHQQAQTIGTIANVVTSNQLAVGETILAQSVLQTSTPQRIVLNSDMSDVSLSLSPSTVSSDSPPQFMVLESASGLVPSSNVTKIPSYSLASAAVSALSSSCNMQKVVISTQGKHLQDTGLPYKGILTTPAHTQIRNGTKRLASVASSQLDTLTSVNTVMDIVSKFALVKKLLLGLMKESSDGKICSIPGSPKSKKIKLDKPLITKDISKRKKIKNLFTENLQLLKCKYYHQQAEYFLLKNGRNIMDYLVWKKKLPTELQDYLIANKFHSSDDVKVITECLLRKYAISNTTSGSDAQNSHAQSAHSDEEEQESVNADARSKRSERSTSRGNASGSEGVHHKSEKSVQKEQQKVSNAETSTESDKSYLSRSLRNRMSDVESEKSATKQNVKSDVKNQKSATKRNAETDVQSEKSATKQNVLQKSVQKEQQKVSNAETSTESDKSYLSRSLRNRMSDVESEKSATKQNVKSDVKNQKSATKQNAETDVQSEKLATKQNVLRKLPFKRNEDATAIPDLKPKVFWWNDVGEGQCCKLGDIPEIRGRIINSKDVRNLYRVLFFQWPTTGQDVVGDILNFNGFPFEKCSSLYIELQNLMEFWAAKTILKICHLLDIRKGDKFVCINNILEFLLKPSARIDPATDPRWQPAVLLERIKIGSDAQNSRAQSAYSDEEEQESVNADTRSERSERSRSKGNASRSEGEGGHSSDHEQQNDSDKGSTQQESNVESEAQQSDVSEAHESDTSYAEVQRSENESEHVASYAEQEGLQSGSEYQSPRSGSPARSGSGSPVHSSSPAHSQSSSPVRSQSGSPARSQSGSPAWSQSGSEREADLRNEQETMSNNKSEIASDREVASNDEREQTSDNEQVAASDEEHSVHHKSASCELATDHKHEYRKGYEACISETMEFLYEVKEPWHGIDLIRRLQRHYDNLSGEKSVQKEQQKVSNAETSTESDKSYLSRSLRNRMSDVESEKSATKQNVKSDVKNQKSATKRNAETDVQSEKSATKQNVLQKSVQKEQQKVSNAETSTKSDKTYLSRSLRNRMSDMASEKSATKQNVKSNLKNQKSATKQNAETDVQSEKLATKQNVLRKLTFRRNNDAPDIPDLKPQVFWLNGVGEGQGCKLGNIPEIRRRILKSENIQELYRVLFFQYPTTGQDVVGDILNFNGFPFEKCSSLYIELQNLMELMPKEDIFEMCRLLDIRKGNKHLCIKEMLDFLLNPSERIDPATDPRWQPVVLLERIKIVSLKQSEEDNDNDEDIDMGMLLDKEDDSDDSEEEEQKSPQKKQNQMNSLQTKPIPENKTPSKKEKTPAKTPQAMVSPKKAEKEKQIDTPIAGTMVFHRQCCQSSMMYLMCACCVFLTSAVFLTWCSGCYLLSRTNQKTAVEHFSAAYYITSECF